MDRSFCLIMQTFHRYSVGAIILCLTFLLVPTDVHAQRGGFRGFGGDRGGDEAGGGGSRFGGFGGFSSGDFLRRLDENGNGRLDEEEISDRIRPMIEARGLDPTGGISFEEFENARDQMRSEFGGGDDGGRRRGFGGGDEGGRGYSRDGDRNNDRSNTEKKPQPRVTFDLPASHAAADTDHDGQLGMYEWRRWNGHSLREFFELDANSDGFVTPREVYLVIGFPQPDERGDDSSGSGVAPTVTISSGPSGISMSPAGSSVSTTTAPGSGDPMTAEATRYFGLLDKDDDGAISAQEWGSSIRIRGMFEKGGLDLSAPMAQDTFVQNYVTLSRADG